MFQYLFKSTLYYYLIKKYKNKILSIIFHILLMIVITILYTDIIEYMVLNNLKQEILYLVLFKWLIYIISSIKIYFNFKSLFIGDKEDDIKYEKEKNKTQKYIDELISKKINLQSQNIDKIIVERLDKYNSELKNKDKLTSITEDIWNNAKSL